MEELCANADGAMRAVSLSLRDRDYLSALTQTASALADIRTYLTRSKLTLRLQYHR